MPARTLAVRVISPSLTGLAEDAVTMDWAFVDDTGDAAHLSEICDALIAFYETDYADLGFGNPGGSVWNMMSDDVRDTIMKYKFYERNTTTNEETFLVQFDDSITPGNATPLPEEVAIRLTAHGVLTGGETDRRKRGGWFLGGGIRTDFATVDSARARPTNEVQIRLRTAARAFLDAQPADWRWVIYSTSYKTSVPVVGGWVDDAWDTIRSRGPAATTRYSWAETP